MNKENLEKTVQIIKFIIVILMVICPIALFCVSEQYISILFDMWIILLFVYWIVTRFTI